VLPKGFNRVRRYGLLAPCNAKRFKTLRHQLLLTAQIKWTTLMALAALSRQLIVHAGGAVPAVAVD
jgi:hypothetical protein